MQTRVVDLNAVVADIAQMLQRLIGEDVSLEIVYAASPVRVQGDPGSSSRCC